MARAVVFLVIAMVAASLGVAQSNSGSSSPQNSTASSSQQMQTSPSSTPAPSTTSAQNPAGHDSNGSTATMRADQRVQDTAQGDGSADLNNSQLPQTSTILPLLGLIGLGSLVAGFFARR